MRKAPKLTFARTCMTANFYAACAYPKESFAQITRRMLGAKGAVTRCVGLAVLKS